jgi:hypothetical protein
MKRPPPGIPYRGDRPLVRPPRGGVKTQDQIEQQIAEIQARIDARLIESMWPSKVAIKVINCDDYDPLD